MKTKVMLLATVVVLTLSWSLSAAPGAFSTELRSRGFSLIPAPQETNLQEGVVRLDRSWRIVKQVAPGGEASLNRLETGIRELHGLEFKGTSEGGTITLLIQPGTVIQAPGSVSDQAYRLSLAPSRVEVIGNGAPGLFYGVQSLLQLLRREKGESWVLPAGVIVDWPALPLRFIHWDTKHHQDRIETLKRFIDWAAFFKANAIGFEIEDKYEYPRHPVIGAPGAFTKAQIQELTAYALERYVQLVPQIQAPAHMAYVLKHEEFAHLRADQSNYQICMCNEEALELIQDLYQDLIDATPGVEYFHASTDEVYYAGICSECQKQRPFNDENRSLAWADFVNRMHDWLQEKGRRMLSWVEYPLLVEDIGRLPRGLINGVITPGNTDQWVTALKVNGIPSLVYSSQQGGELLFPGYFPVDHPYRGVPRDGRLDEPARTVQEMIDRGAALLGTYAAAWDDSGLHNETFWLGWATVTQYGWTPGRPRIEQSVADFMDVFYGPGNQDLIEIYRIIMEGARFYESSWDRVPATRLKPTYGSWAGKGRDTTRIDLTLTPPSLPFSYDETLIADRSYSHRYAQILEQAPLVRKDLRSALLSLQGKLGQVERNRYNLEVLLAIAYFEKDFTDMLLSLQDVEGLLLKASQAVSEERSRDAVALLAQAHENVSEILRDRAEMWNGVVDVFEKSRFPKGQRVGGREFVHVLDDLKDHPADRRAGLDYMLEPLENMGLEEWNRQLANYIRVFAAGRSLESPTLSQ